MRKQECKQRPLEFDLQEAEPWIVKVTETVRLAPRVKQIVGRMETPKRWANP